VAKKGIKGKLKDPGRALIKRNWPKFWFGGKGNKERVPNPRVKSPSKNPKRAPHRNWEQPVPKVSRPKGVPKFGKGPLLVKSLPKRALN